MTFPATNLLHAMPRSRLPPPWSLQAFTNRLAHRLLPACDWNIANARQEIRWLTEHVLQEANGMDGTGRRALQGFVRTRVVKHKPLQYILGTQPFCDLDIITRPPVLIPRWETEEWTTRLHTLLIPHLLTRPPSQPFRILDLCTGTGCIALSLAAHLPPQSATIQALDIAPHALALADLNTRTLAPRLQNPVAFIQADIMLDPITNAIPRKACDLVVSNPPYVTNEEYAGLEPDVKEWEDQRALVAGEGGMAFHWRIARVVARTLLREGGGDGVGVPRLVMEIGGRHQVEGVTRVLKEEGFKRVEVWEDMAGRKRCVVA
ncbi:S-adenosyl-L-methionine-dependent methyltransferase, partial [Jimgerdemannia flammicorona]